MKLLRILLWPLGFDWVDEVSNVQFTDTDYKELYENYMQLKSKGTDFETAWKGIVKFKQWDEKTAKVALAGFEEYIKKMPQETNDNTERKPVIL